MGATAVLSDEVLKKFLPKRQQINQCELFTAYTLVANEADMLRGADDSGRRRRFSPGG